MFEHTGRNAPCPCGSGKKYKKCCLAKDRQNTSPARTNQSAIHHHLSMAKSALERSDYKAVRRHIQPVLEENPKYGPALSLAFSAELRDRQYEKARDYSERALEIEPENPILLYNQATCLSLLGEKKASVPIFKRALDLKPDLYQAYTNLANTYRDLGQPDEAINCYFSALEHNRRDIKLLNHCLVSMHQFSFDNSERLFELHRELGQRIAEHIPDNIPQRRPGTKSRAKIRLGYFSPKFSRNIIGYFFKPIFDNHDRSRFEIYLYSGTSLSDDLTEHFQSEADKWTDVRNLSDMEFCQAVVDDEIDILFDLAGHNPDNRIMTFARKPAPVQISMLDYFDTTGLESMDYFVSDRYSTPENSSQKFTEELLYLDRPRLVYAPPAYAPDIKVRPRVDNSVVFGSFNRHEKISQEVVKVWARLLREIDGAYLVLKNEAFELHNVADSYTERFVNEGVNPAQLIFRGKSPHVEMLAEYGDIDVALDTFPYNGGLTTLEALWMGTPVVTLEGKRLIGRQSAGMLMAMGFPDLIAENTDEYVNICKYWASNRDELNLLRSQLRNRMSLSALTDGAVYTRELEENLERIWRELLASQ